MLIAQYFYKFIPAQIGIDLKLRKNNLFKKSLIS